VKANCPAGLHTELYLDAPGRAVIAVAMMPNGIIAGGVLCSASDE